MPTKGSYLILKERDTVYLSLAIKDVITLEKHFIEERNRSFLCHGTDCDFCRQHIIKRIRYQAPVIVDGESLIWEFGDDIYNKIVDMPRVEGFINIVVTRLGTGRKTRYQVRAQDARILTPDKYIQGKYGHMVLR